MSPAPAGRLHRAVGIETEYGVTSAHVAAGLDGAPLSVEEAVQEVFRDVSSPPSGTHRFTTSGARLYIDIGMHPEYAGPECVWATDAVAQDLAGDAVERLRVGLRSGGQSVAVEFLDRGADDVELWVGGEVRELPLEAFRLGEVVGVEVCDELGAGRLVAGTQRKSQATIL